MFGLKKKGPTQPFTHVDNCKILKADPTVQIEWSEVETGRWEAVCVCGHEWYHEPAADDRVANNPRDPKHSRHEAVCEFAGETDAGRIKAILKVRDGLGGGYWWVECNACDCAWQVPHYAESVA